MLLVVDALGDHGRSGGVDGAASSLDLSVRAAAAVAEHHIRAGDRVGLRVVGGGGGLVGYGAGTRHLRVLLDQLAGVRAGELPEGIADRLQLRVTGGSVVFVFSPMLGEAIVTATATLVQRGAARGGRRHASAGRERPGCPTASTRGSPSWPGGCAGSSATGARRARRPRLPGDPLARAPARSTTCCAGWPAAPAAAGLGRWRPVKLLTRESRSRLLLRAVVLVAPVLALLLPGPATRRTAGSSRSPLALSVGVRGDARVAAGRRVPRPGGRLVGAGRGRRVPVGAVPAARSCSPPTSPRCCCPTGRPRCRSAPRSSASGCGAAPARSRRRRSGGRRAGRRPAGTAGHLGRRARLRDRGVRGRGYRGHHPGGAGVSPTRPRGVRRARALRGRGGPPGPGDVVRRDRGGGWAAGRARSAR